MDRFDIMFLIGAILVGVGFSVDNIWISLILINVALTVLLLAARFAYKESKGKGRVRSRS